MKKIALVTGGAKRIGADIAKHLATKGWRVVIHYNSSEKEAKKLQAQLPGSFIIEQDLSKLDQLDAFLLNIKKSFGTPTLLINNASIFEKDITAPSIDKLQTHMNINCFAPILLSQIFAQHGGEKIINIADATANGPAKTYFSYNLSKAALLHATKSLALLLAPNCRVNSVSPGFTLEPSDQFVTIEASTDENCSYGLRFRQKPPRSEDTPCLAIETEKLVIASEAQQSTEESTDGNCGNRLPRRPKELLTMTDKSDAEILQNIPLRKKTKIREIISAIDLILASHSMTGQNIDLA